MRMIVVAAGLLASPLLASFGEAQDFPVTVETKFGPAVVEQTPERVVSIGYITQDFLLALGVVPIALRDWYGQKPYGTWEWAQDELGDAQPVVMYGEINVERIAALQPDLIVAYWSGLTKNDHALLSQVAPVLAPAEGETDYGTSWQDMLHRTGVATGKAHKAAEIQTRLDARFAQIRSDHPEWAGQEMAIAWPGNIGAYTPEDLRGKMTQDLGLSVPKAFEELDGPNPFYVLIPDEDLSSLDAAALVWMDSGGRLDMIKNTSLRRTLTAHAEGREIYAGPDLAGALSFSSPLSLDYALDRLVPLMEAALDGDPSTPVPSSVEAGLAP